MDARYLISSICDGFFAYLAVDLANSHHTSASDTHHSLPEAEQEAPRICRSCHRHIFATRAVEVGFEIKSLSEILGHASVTITLDRYVHSSLELKRDNMQKLNAAGM